MNVELPGRLDRTEVVALLHDSRVGMVLFQPVANYVEAYPTKLFEYMASELPVVASDFPVWRQIVAGVDCGLLARPTDPIAVADAMRKSSPTPSAPLPWVGADAKQSSSAIAGSPRGRDSSTCTAGCSRAWRKMSKSRPKP